MNRHDEAAREPAVRCSWCHVPRFPHPIPVPPFLHPAPSHRRRRSRCSAAAGLHGKAGSAGGRDSATPPSRKGLLPGEGAFGRACTRTWAFARVRAEMGSVTGASSAGRCRATSRAARSAAAAFVAAAAAAAAKQI